MEKKKTGQTVASAQYPDAEAPITSKQAGWAEQEPESWWKYLCQATQKVLADTGAKGEDVKAIGISYQMHGLVCVDKEGKALRPSIIWCDGRAVPYGNAAFEAIGGDMLTVNRCTGIASLGGSQENSEEEYLILKLMRMLGVIAIDNQGRV